MMYHQSKKDNCSRVSSLKNQVKDTYSYEGMEFPAVYNDIFKFEELDKVCVLVYTISPEDTIALDKPGTLTYIQTT